MSDLSLFLVLLFVLIFLIYKWSLRRLSYWKNKNIPYIKPLPIFGNYFNTLIGREGMIYEYTKFYNEMQNEKYFGTYIGHKPTLLIKDPELVRSILIKDFQYFYDRGFHTNDKDFIGNNLFFMRNPKWKNLRLKVAPVFSSIKLKQIFQVVDSSCDELIEMLSTKDIEDIGTREIMSTVLSAIVAKAICGIEIYTLQNPNKEHLAMQNEIFKSSFRSQMRYIVNYTSPYLAKMFNVFTPMLDGYFSKVTWNTIRMRKENNIERNDFLQLLMEVYDKEKTLPPDERKIDKDDITSCIFIFIAAGYETTTSGISSILHELAYHPDVQNKLREEIQTVYEIKNKIDYDDLKKLKYMDQVISETLRLYPIAITLFRECMEDYKIPGTNHTIEKGVAVHIPHYGLHLDPKYWKNPNVFDPDRFSDENIDSITPGTYLPFGDGPRFCIGKRFFFLKSTLIISKLLLNFEITPCEKSIKNIKFVRGSLIAPPDSQFWLKFKKIKKKN